VYSPVHKFAGDRMWSAAVGQELWAKPLTENRVGAVVFNRNGTTPKCLNHAADFGDAGSVDCPCDDNTTSPDYGGVQTISFDFSVLPSAWLLGSSSGGANESSNSLTTEDTERDGDGGAGAIACHVRDIFSSATGKGKDLGRFSGSFEAKDLGPHASRFLLLSNCKRSG
jgi:hypothetical protein